MIEVPPSGAAVAEKSMELEIDNHVRPFHVFARLLAGNTKTLLFDTPLVCALAVKKRIFDFTKLPISEQRLICAGRQLDDDSLIPAPDSTVHLCLRLRGGKGGFGSLLRGAATKAGQKKTNNFDACRDMSGRRLRHVNAEKKLEEWRAEEEDRRLEKIAEDFIKKASKKSKKGAGEGEAQKYVQKYREESAKCVAQVELSVREAIGSYTSRAKRKSGEGEDAGLHGKKLKIWMGKRKMADSDSDEMDENSSEGEDDEDNEKSVILDNSNSSDSVKDAERSSDSLTGERQECRAAASTESGSEEEKEIISQEISVSGGCSSNESLSNQRNSLAKSVSHVDSADQGSAFPPSEAAAASADGSDQTGKEELDKFKHGNNEVATNQTPSDLLNSGEESVIAVDVPHVSNDVLETKVVVMDNTTSLKADKGEEKPLNFEEYNSAAELEVLGLERLKTELQMRGLKCGGTLQERACRLYLLKSVTLDKIPKRHLAKK